MRAWAFAGLLVSAVACGGASNDELFEEPGTGGSAGSGTGGSTGGKGAGGGTAGKGTGGSATGGTATGGTGTGGTGTGGTGTGGSETGGTGTGGSEAGGTGTGGSETGGTGTGGSTGGSGASGGSGATGGTSAAGTGGGPAGAGGRGMTTGGTAGRAGGGGNAGAVTCESLAKAYEETLPAALACNPDIDEQQCTEHVPASIPCGCPIHVNAANEEAIAELKGLSEQHSKMGCVEACPAIACLDRNGVCSKSGSGNVGRCEEEGGSK